MSFARSHADELGIPQDYFEGRDVHVHVPEGAIPKDGPSAGITIATSMLSAFTGRPVRDDIAMTGEITLRGTVLPVGGVKEKVLAARRHGRRTVLLPHGNRRRVEELARSVRREMELVPVRDVRDVFEIALLPPAKSPVVRSGARRRPAVPTTGH
jgi:ATP-dependent Lon protease